MRSTLACATLTAFALAAASASAQTTPTGGTGTGSCSGTLAGTVGLSVNQDGSLQSIQAAAINTVFGNAECECSPTDTDQQINLEIKLTTALPIGTAETAEVWVGPSCDQYINRTTGTPIPCQKVAVVPIQNLTTASTTNGLIEIPIPGSALMSPNVNPPMCTIASESNFIYLFVYSNPQMPDATCSLNLTEQNQPPTSVSNVRAGSGDGSVTLNWDLPAAGSFNATFFQILCTDDCGGQVKSSPPAPQYSTCIDGVLHRREIQTGGTTTGTIGDAGVTTTDDAGTFSLPTHTLEPLATPPATINCTNDMGMNSAFPPNDMGSNGPLSNLNPIYTCSGQLAATASEARITGLTNNNTYHFVVLAIDAFGNATPSALVSATPQPTEDLYRRYRDAGGAPGGCFIATAAFGSYENNWVYILRDFRDEVLLPSDLGHAFVEWYYEHSPPAAGWIAERPWARAITRVLLLPLIAGAFFWVYFAAWQKAIFILLLAALLLRKRLAAALARGQRA